MILDSPSFWKFFDYARDSSFEVATDAFGTIHDILTLHPSLTGMFLVQNSSRFVDIMSELMTSDNYVTKRQSLKIMAHIITHRANYTFMTEYVDNVENLKLTMVLLRDKSKNIQYEAFNIFKVFVANPKKSRSVLDILIKNKTKLVNYLSNFQSERKDDETFQDEKLFIINQISTLPNTTSTSTTPSAIPSATTSRRTSPIPESTPNNNTPTPPPPPGRR